MTPSGCTPPTQSLQLGKFDYDRTGQGDDGGGQLKTIWKDQKGSPPQYTSRCGERSDEVSRRIPLCRLNDVPNSTLILI
jgi:hypothetical protein